MISFKNYMGESIKKNSWSFLASRDKEDYSDDLIRSVHTAYSSTSLGSFVNNLTDVKNSEWIALDYDAKPDLDVSIFFRKSRSNESWVGRKIQGIGHDGSSEGKSRLMKKVVEILKQDGTWIEASEGMAASLKRRGSSVCTDQAILKKIFPSITEFHSDGSYTRNVGGSTQREFIFGRPKLK